MDEAIWDGYYDEYCDNIDNYADWEEYWEDYDESLDDATRPVCMTGRADGDEMTEEDWDRYSREFEARYNEHLRSIKSSSPRRVRGLREKCNPYDDYSEGSYDEGDALEKCYFEEYGIGSLLPTTEEIEHYRRALGCDDEYNLRMAVSGMCRPHEDTMAEFFLESQW